MSKGFVGGTNDNTGLTHLGAREYDPKIGRFISVDPVQDFNNPQQWNGYSYANNTPTTSSDPTGLIPTDCLDHDCDYAPGCESCNRKKKEKASKSSNNCYPLRCGESTKESTTNRVDPCKIAPNSAYCITLKYMVLEMQVNSRSDAVLNIHTLLQPGRCLIKIVGLCASYSNARDDLISALSQWAALVCQGCKWDHKPVLREMFDMDLEDLDSLMMEIPGTGLRLNYDIFSNIHYAYVGTEAGFDSGTLHSIDKLPGMPIVGRSDKSDGIFIQLGIDLHKKTRPADLTTADLHSTIMSITSNQAARDDRKVLTVK
jgi:RHS repeat-associated protein